MEDLLIFPYNGNGLEALDCLGNQFNFIGFVDDTLEKQGTNFFGHSVFDRTAFEKYPNAKVLAVPGSPTSFRIRNEIIAGLNLKEERFTRVIHPNASVSQFAKIGTNVLIMAGVVVTSNSILGNNICILPNTVIHHDVEVKEYTLIGSNVTVAGNTIIGSNCYIGSGTSIINGIYIGNNTLIGMGSNVIKNLSESSKVAGNPAKQL